MAKSGKAALENMKYEVANSLGVNMKKGYNGDLSSNGIFRRKHFRTH